jgi:NAD(P)-dependent dehydrogenase (short-subunit alcohol dehydrogenase family)
MTQSNGNTMAGRVAIVTGGGRGVGRGYARLLAAENASVVVSDLPGDPDAAQQVVDEITAAGGTAIASHADITSWTGGAELIGTALDAYGRLDVLICNAGMLRDRTLALMSEAEWDDIVHVHLKGTFVPTHFAAAHWRDLSKRTGSPVDGRIILTTSEAGLYGNAGQTNYAAAKAGIASMTVVAARELRRYGVKVNAIAPRARTRLTEATFGDFGRAGEFDYWDPDNVAPWVVYLCGPHSSHISGQVFVVGGGRVELMQGWQSVEFIEQDRPWRVEELPVASEKLFTDRKTVPPRFPDVGLPPALKRAEGS